MKALWNKIISGLILGLIWVVFFSTPLNPIPNKASAHPQPLVVQEFQFKYRTTGINLDLNLRIDPVIANDIFEKLDQNKNEALGEDDLRDYAQNIVLPNLNSRFNNRDLEYEITGLKPIKKTDIRSLDNFAQVSFRATNAQMKETNSIYVKYNYRFLPEDPFGDTFLYMDDIFDTQGIERINLGTTNPNGTIEYSTDFRFNGSPFPQNRSSEEKNGFNTNFIQDLQRLSTDLTNQVKNFDFSNPFVFFSAFVLLFIAGALHALTPGHGKSMVAAFLIGKKKSKLADVFILGFAITLSHTLAIYIIGFVLLAIRQTSEAQNIVLAIERLSAWLFLGLGFILIYNGWKAYKHWAEHEEMHKHGHHHHHDEHGNHIHEHHHGHTHFWEKQDLKITNRWQLFYAGVAGGIIPCFDALSILFVFNTLGRVDLGLILVFIFSFGLASAIIMLGVSLLYGKDKFKLEEKIGPKAEFILPFISGTIIALFGIFYIFTK